MQDPFAWSVPFGRLFGVTIRIHVLFPLVAVALILRAACEQGVPPGGWIDATVLMALLFLSVLLHEYGHCFGARAVNGDAHEVLLWPLGGLAAVDVPHTPRANLITAAAGPAVNLFLGGASLLLLLGVFNVKPWFGFKYLGRWDDGMFHLALWGGGEERARFLPYSLPVLLHQFFWVNY